MGVIHVIDRVGERHTLEALEGWRVMEIIRDWKLPIEGICGGACECATCHVFVAPEWLPKLNARSSEEERTSSTPSRSLRRIPASPARSSGRPNSTGSR